MKKAINNTSKYSGDKHGFYTKYGKRAFDIFFSLVAIVLLSPILLILTIFVRIIHGSPILFSPTRPGLNERIFHIYKFRSMSNKRDNNGILLPDKERITMFGEILRATSLDELPELFNILLGDMSFVGPRPQAKPTLTAYTDEQRERFNVRPGLTGLAQIHGRNALDWDTRFDYDLEYVRKMSFFYDIKIIIDTILKVLKSDDVTVPGTTGLLYFNAQRKIDTEGKVQPVGEQGKRMEIGGEYWLPENTDDIETNNSDITWLPETADSTFTFAGRAAIELAIMDISAHRKIKKVCVPSYCSFGMLQPFVERDISFDFYDVTWDGSCFKYQIDPKQKYDIVLLMTYFGINTEYTEQWIRTLREKGSIIIEDITHTLLADYCRKEYPDYYTASIRKWFPIPSGGWLGKLSGSLSCKADISGGTKVDDAISAMKEKGKYITGQSDEKNEYLQKLADFDVWLVTLNCKTEIDDLSKALIHQMNIPEIKQQRRANANRLYQRLSSIEEITFMNKPEDWKLVSPIMVPILLQHRYRNELAESLAQKGIYCPVIWPERMGALSGIRDNELSLVCDQRYTEKDMDRTADYIIEFFHNKQIDQQKRDET